MRIKNKIKFEQTEIFEVHKKISKIIIPGENILYQIKSYKKKNEYQLYFTNKRICIINPNYCDEIREYISLDDLQGISFRKKYYSDDFGEIEFISEKIKKYIDGPTNEKRHSNFFYVSNNLQNIIKVVESILWYYTNVNERLDTLKNEEKIQLPKDFSNFLKKDKVFIPQKKTLDSIEFNQNLYLNYSTSNFGFNPSFGKIIFKPSFNSKIKIKCKYHNDPLKVLELIYFLSLFWKQKNGLLMDKEELKYYLIDLF